MRIVVTGREGQVARALQERGAAAGHEILALGRPDFDLAGDKTQVSRALIDARPEAIVSAAAYTAVDKAESDSEMAFAVNAVGARAVARAARQLDVPLIHLSTDYVFDGSKATPYKEEDETAPAGVYGASKLAGEQEVLQHHDKVAVLRTAWVYSPFGSNFVRTMLRLAETRDEVGVVADQRGNPTSALDIADAIMEAASNLLTGASPSHRGLFHLAGRGAATWAEFAEAIFQFSRDAGGPWARVRQITTADYPTPAKRPANSQLDCTKLEQAHGVRLPDWRSSASQTVSRLVGSDHQGKHSA